MDDFRKELVAGKAHCQEVWEIESSRADYIGVFISLKWEGQLGVRHERNVMSLLRKSAQLTEWSHDGPERKEKPGFGFTQKKEKRREASQFIRVFTPS